MDPMLEQLLKKKMLEDPYLYHKFPWMYRNPWEGGQFGEGGSFPSIGLDMGGVPFGGALTGGMYSYPSQSQQLQSQSPQIPVESLAKMGIKGYQALTKGGQKSSAVFPVEEGLAELPVPQGAATPTNLGTDEMINMFQGETTLPFFGAPTSQAVFPFEEGMANLSPQLSSAVFPVDEGMASLPSGIGNLASKGGSWLSKGLIANPFGAFMGGAKMLGAETPGYSAEGSGLGGLLGGLAFGPIGGLLGGLAGMIGGGLFGGGDTPQEKAEYLVNEMAGKRGGAMMGDIANRGLGQLYDPSWKPTNPVMSIPDYSKVGNYPTSFGLTDADIANVMAQIQYLSPGYIMDQFNQQPGQLGSEGQFPFYYTDVPIGQIGPGMPGWESLGAPGEMVMDN